MDYGSSIEEEKAKAEAISRYRRIQKFARIWWLVEVFVALILLLISFPLIRLQISANSFYNFSFRRLTDFILNPHINFIVGNAIIAVLFLLSRQNNDGREVSNESNLDSLAETVSVSVFEIETEFPSCPAAVVEEKVGDVVVETKVKLHCEAVSNAIEDATKQIRRFERTQSEKLRRELRSKQREKFRRSESEIGVRRSSGEDDSVNDLSSEEFRRKIERFIEKEKHERSFRAQKTAEKIF